MRLTHTEMLVLKHLVKNSGRYVAYQELSNALWGTEYPGSMHAIAVYVGRIKNKLQRLDKMIQIHNRPNVGYAVLPPA